ncbi:MAG: protein-L-isoaspartate O-methyltransferase [Hyphomicrobiaceae bacterium]|nr:protein-L-isoaspartate O-methyltransferase [Hyphomicrobiaceae bacterium]
MSEYAVARYNMVESQIRPNQVTDEHLLRSLSEIPRERFVPASLQDLAYMEEEIEVAPSRRLLAPMPLARLIQLADVGRNDLVLDVGCATGYSTAVLARLADSVVGLESDDRLAEQAGQALMDLEADNAAIVTGPLNEGYASEGSFDVILLNGAVPVVSGALLEQLKDGGRLVAILAEAGFGQAYLYRKSGSRVSHRPAFDAGGPLLPGFEREKEFVF